MTPVQLREELAARGFARQADAARALRVDQATISRWLNGKAPIDPMVEVALRGIPSAQDTSKTPSGRRRKANSRKK